MTTASITSGSVNATAINPSEASSVVDNGDSTCTVFMKHRAAFRSDMTAAAVLTALGWSAIAVTRSGNSRANSFNPTAIVYVDPWINPNTQGAGCQLKIEGDAAVFRSDTALATVQALLDPTKTASVTRSGSTTPSSVTRDQVVTADVWTNPATGALGCQLRMKDGSIINTDSTVATVTTALNA